MTQNDNGRLVSARAAISREQTVSPGQDILATRFLRATLARIAWIAEAFEDGRVDEGRHALDDLERELGEIVPQLESRPAQPPDLGALASAAAEGAVDRLSRRTREQNPYSPEVDDCRRAWDLGWLEADARVPRVASKETTGSTPRNLSVPLSAIGGGCSRYGLAALRRHADRAARAVEGTRRNTLNGSAFALGQLVGSGHLRADVVEDELRRAALETGLPVVEIERTIAAGLRDGQAKPYFPAGRAA